MGGGNDRFFCYSTLSASLPLLFLLCPLVAEQYGITRIGTEQGLSEGHVYCVLQDSRGFMWFGTRDGLNRYDGYEFKTFRNDPDDPHSLSNNIVYALWEDAFGVLWIGTNGGGLNRFDRAQRKFTHFRHNPKDKFSLSHDIVRDIVGDSDSGVLWIGTLGGGLNCFDTKTGRSTHFRHDPNNTDSLGSDNIWCLALTESGAVWIGTKDAGLIRMSPSEPVKFARIDHQSENPNCLSDTWIWALYCDKQDAIWVGSAGPLKRMRPHDSDRFESILQAGSKPIEYTQAIIEVQDGTFWVGTEKGLFQLDRAGGEISSWQQAAGDPSTLAQSNVWNLLQDNKGNLWATHFGNGISLLAPNPFQHYKGGSADEVVVAVLLDREENLWLGTEISGLLQREREPGRSLKNKPSDLAIPSIVSLLEDRRGNFWIGTSSDGLYHFDRTRSELTNFHAELEIPNNLSKAYVNSLCQDQNGALWVGTQEGLIQMEPDQPETFVTYRHDPSDRKSLSDSEINCVFGSNRNKTLWIGTFYGGLNRMELNRPGEFISYRHEPGNPAALSSNAVHAIAEDGTGTLWLGTLNGLNRFDPQTGKTRPFLAQEGLDSNIIHCILWEERGYLWISTPKGLSRFDPVSEKFQGFNRYDGLAVENFRDRCGFRDTRGRLYFGGVGGVIAFLPEDIVANPFPPQMAITAFLVDKKLALPRHLDPKSPLRQSIEEADSVELVHGIRSLSLRFAAMHYSAPKKNRYKYCLENFDKGWIETDADDRHANYTNLDPGSYTFHIKGSNKDGVWSEETSLKIYIPSPPWQTWWAFMFYGMALIALVVWYVSHQRQKLAQEHRLLKNERHVTERLRQVDALKDEFLTNTSHELRTPLHGMVGLAESLIDGVTGELPEATRGNLAMIVSSGRRLGNLVNDILDFSNLRNKGLDLQFRAVDLYGLVEVVLTLIKPLAHSKNLVLFNKIPKNLPPIRADEDRLQQVLHNLVGNAIKFTQEGSVTVSADLEETEVLIQVTDTGLGIDPVNLERIFLSFEQVDAGVSRAQGGTGLGLTICRQLVELHGGKIQADSSLGQGSTFFFKLAISTEEEPVEGPRLTTRFEQLEDVRLSPIETDELESRGHHVLVVDDDPVNRQVLCNHLALLKHRFTEAANGEEALAALEREHFDLVLLDIMMPRMSGYEVCRKIRERLDPHQLPVIFLSARNRVPDLAEGFASGANDYLTKPVARQELLSRLELHLRLRDSVHLLAALNQEQRALDEVVREVNREMALEGLLGTMLDLAIRHIAEAEGGALFLWQQQEKCFKIVASSGYEAHEIKDVCFSREQLVARYMGEDQESAGPSELVRRHGEPLPFEHVRALPVIRDMLSMPLYLEGELEGFLVLDNFSSDSAFDTTDVRMLDRFREHAVSALAKARFLRALQDQHQTLVRTQEQLLMQDKMASLGTLTAGIGHEINNPTNFVYASAQNMVSELKRFRTFLLALADDAEAEVLASLKANMDPLFGHMETITEGARRITYIVRDLHTFSRQDRTEVAVSPVDLEACLRSTLNLVRPNFSNHVDFIQHYVHLVVPGRQASLNQVFMNLIVNACQAMVVISKRDGVKGQLTIRTTVEGEWGRVAFEDTGGGIPAEIRGRIFEPFFTTKGVGEGTGLGLSISYGIVERHRGRIEVDSVEGQSATFTLFLPLAEESLDP